MTKRSIPYYLKLRELFLRTPAGTPTRRWIIRRRHTTAAKQWDSSKPLPAPEPIKRSILRHYLKHYALEILIETGTFWGDTIAALEADCRQIYSIELSSQLYAHAKKRFKGHSNVHLLNGDSAKILPGLLADVTEPVLFWLDAHYSHNETARGETDTPIEQELRIILAAAQLSHVILIDDARFFGADPAYPTIDDVRRLIESSGRELDFSVETDIIRITPRVRG
jgi:hypothetical protein